MAQYTHSLHQKERYRGHSFTSMIHAAHHYINRSALKTRQLVHFPITSHMWIWSFTKSNYTQSGLDTHPGMIGMIGMLSQGFIYSSSWSNMSFCERKNKQIADNTTTAECCTPTHQEARTHTHTHTHWGCFGPNMCLVRVRVAIVAFRGGYVGSKELIPSLL